MTANLLTAQPLPGAEPWDEKTVERVGAVLNEERSAEQDYHTRHLDEKGEPIYVNRLILSTSPSE